MKEKSRPLGYPKGKAWPAWRRGEKQEPCPNGHYPTRIRLTGGSQAEGLHSYSGHCLDCGHKVRLLQLPPNLARAFDAKEFADWWDKNCLCERKSDGGSFSRANPSCKIHGPEADRINKDLGVRV